MKMMRLLETWFMTVLMSSVKGQYSLSQCTASQEERIYGQMIKVPCKPRTEVVPITHFANYSDIIQVIPSHVEVKRCGGSCFTPAHSCNSISHTKKEVQVMLLTSRFKQGELDTLCMTVDIKEDTACECSCTVKPSDCSALQTYDPARCKCVCNNYNVRNNCIKKGRSWDPDTCTCGCPVRSWRVCNTGYTFDGQNECKCVPIILMGSPSILIVLSVVLVAGIAILSICIYDRREHFAALKRRGSLIRVLEEEEIETR